MFRNFVQGDAGALNVDFWHKNATAFIARMESQYPHYRDLMHPLKQAILECDHGLLQMVQPLGAGDSILIGLVKEIAQFPRFRGQHLHLEWSLHAAKILATGLIGLKCKFEAHFQA